MITDLLLMLITTELPSEEILLKRFAHFNQVETKLNNNPEILKKEVEILLKKQAEIAENITKLALKHEYSSNDFIGALASLIKDYLEMEIETLEQAISDYSVIKESINLDTISKTYKLNKMLSTFRATLIKNTLISSHEIDIP